MADFALSTFFINDIKLTLKVYCGKDGSFNLYEDDGITENYKKGEKRITKMNYTESSKTLIIKSAEGSYKNSPQSKEYEINFYGLKNKLNAKVNDKPLKELTSKISAKKNNGIYWDDSKKILTLFIEPYPVSKDLNVKLY